MQECHSVPSASVTKPYSSKVSILTVAAVPQLDAAKVPSTLHIPKKCHHLSTLSTTTTAVHQHSVWSAFYNTPVNMTDPIRIRSGSAGKHWPEAGRMILAHRLASGPDPFGPKPDTVSQT